MNCLSVVTLSSIAIALMVTVSSAESPDTPQYAVEKAYGVDRQRQGKGESNRPHASALLAALDADGDGSISAEEISKASSALLSVDKNGDGMLSLDELRLEGAASSDAKKSRYHRRRGDRPKHAAAEKSHNRVTIDIDINVPVIVARGRSSIVIRSPHGDDYD